jgi:drug/metabolite transporter (DMT)-like permease
LSIWIAILLITLASTGWNIGVIMQKRAADRLPFITMRHGGASTMLRFLRSPLWMGGLVVTGLGWGAYVYALNSTPVSLARAITGSGYVLLALLAIIFLKYRLTLVEWLAVITVTIGVILIGRSEQNGAVEPAHLDNVKLTLGVVATTTVCLLFFLLSRHRIPLAADRPPLTAYPSGTSTSSTPSTSSTLHSAIPPHTSSFLRKPVVTFSVVSGVLSAAGDLLTKALLIAVHSGQYLAAFLIHAPLIIVFYLTGFFALSRAYQHGSAVTAVIISDFAVRVGSACLGLYVLGEVFPAAPTLRVFRILGFLVVLTGSTLLGRFSGEEPIRPQEG